MYEEDPLGSRNGLKWKEIRRQLDQLEDYYESQGKGRSKEERKDYWLFHQVDLLLLYSYEVRTIRVIR